MNCPICGGSGCTTYPLMLEQWAAGRRRDHWKRVHDQLSGIAQTPAYPSLAAQARNAASAAGQVVAAALTGQAVIVDRAERERRLAICAACPEFDPARSRCRRCGCFAQLKARVATGGCPLAKW